MAEETDQTKLDQTVAKYSDPATIAARQTAGEGIPLVETAVRMTALEDLPDGAVMVHLLVVRIAASAETPVAGDYGQREKFWTSNSFTPSGSWPVKVRLESREIAESLEGVAIVGKEVTRLIAEQHRLILLFESEDGLPVKPTGQAATPEEWVAR